MLELKDRLPRRSRRPPAAGGAAVDAPAAARRRALGADEPGLSSAACREEPSTPPLKTIDRDGDFEQHLEAGAAGAREVGTPPDARRSSGHRRARRRGRAVRSRTAPARARRVHRAGPRPREPAGRRLRRRSSAAKRSITCCSTARPGSARRRWPTSSPTRWACRSGRPPGPVIEKPGDLAGDADQPQPTTRCCSSTRSTGCRRRSRRSSIRRWRTTSSTSSSARGRARGR